MHMTEAIIFLCVIKLNSEIFQTLSDYVYTVSEIFPFEVISR